MPIPLVSVDFGVFGILGVLRVAITMPLVLRVFGGIGIDIGPHGILGAFGVLGVPPLEPIISITFVFGDFLSFGVFDTVFAVFDGALGLLDAFTFFDAICNACE
jgi:hypothetical protein